MLRCWSEDAEIRPSASEVIELLTKPPFYDPNPPTTQLMVSMPALCDTIGIDCIVVAVLSYPQCIQGTHRIHH